MPAGKPQRMAAPHRILCSGIAVIDQVFRVSEFPLGDGKIAAHDYVSVVGGGAANAAVAIARLGGAARYAGPLGGGPGEDPIGDRIIAALEAEGIDCSGCVRVDGASSAVSAVLVDAAGGRAIIHHRAGVLRKATPADPERLVAEIDSVLADDHCPQFAAPICAAARRRGLPVVLDIEKKVLPADLLFAMATHRIFSRAGLCATLDLDNTISTDALAAALAHMAGNEDAFYAVTDGAGAIPWCAGHACGKVPVFPVEAVDTLAAGDVFHGAFALALLEGGDGVEALRFAAATAAIKCTRFGGGAAAPTREEVDCLLAAP
ncbi:MAG: PfkB family carbohydrate kinase [Xanthobacteraceae bacterium]